MARPPKDPGEQLLRFTVRLHVDDLLWLEEVAARHELSQSAVLRQLITNGRARYKQRQWFPRRSSGAA